MADTAKVYNKTYELLQKLFRISDDAEEVAARVVGKDPRRGNGFDRSYHIRLRKQSL